MIINVQKFIAEERPYWQELEGMLNSLEADPAHRMDLNQAKRFHYLYQRTSSALAKMATFSSEPRVRTYLESLVGRVYGEIHESRERPNRLSFVHWFFGTFPQVFRRHIAAFWLALSITTAGALFGGIAVMADQEAKAVLLPFVHLQGDPSERVAYEERAKKDRLEESKATFASFLMTHNTKVSVFVLALGMTWGIGTILVLFGNGVVLGAVALDYIAAGESTFLVGWLLPHGAIEIPAILLAGQAGLVLAGALIGWGRPVSLKDRLRRTSPDLVTLICGVAIMLVWAGIVESFFSQYHKPVIPYEVKIGFGVIELLLLTWFLSRAGVKKAGAAQGRGR